MKCSRDVLFDVFFPMILMDFSAPLELLVILMPFANPKKFVVISTLTGGWSGVLNHCGTMQKAATTLANEMTTIPLNTVLPARECLIFNFMANS